MTLLIAVLMPAGALVLGAAQAGTPLRAVPSVSGLENPVAFVQDAADPSTFFAVEQAGRIRLVRNGAVQGDFLDLRAAVSSGGERGLLGLALSPDFEQSGRFFVNFTDPRGDTVIARFRRGSASSADASSRFDLRWGSERSPVIAQPFTNHNGGHLAFGPDGYLYIGLGDGGSADDPGHRAQDPASLLGKFLRVDVAVPDSHGAGYVVPAGNPFAGGGAVQARPEIWSFGWRNPWRYSFDAPARGGTGALVAADVGQGRVEEIDYEPRGQGGRNYGWRNREGMQPHIETRPPAFGPLVPPVHEYGRSDGRSVTGGYVYRGSALGEEYRGRYFFADFVSGRVWSIRLAADANGNGSASDLLDHTAELGGASVLGNISSFGEDGAGELYIVSYSRGTVLRLLRTPSAPSNLRIVR